MKKPGTCWEVLKRRFALFRRDLTENWFPCTCSAQKNDIKTKRLEVLLKKQRETKYINKGSLPNAVPRRLSSVGNVQGSVSPTGHTNQAFRRLSSLSPQVKDEVHG